MSSEIAAVEKACRLLFGEQTPVSAAFLDYMQLAGLKDAYRSLAKANHPDRAHVVGGSQDDLNNRFNAIRNAYELVRPYVTGEKVLEVAPVPIPRREAPAGGWTDPGQEKGAPFSESDQKDRFWTGAIPARALRFGQYLYYTRNIGWNMLVAALVWQRSNRPKLGELALERGMLSAKEVLAIRRASCVGELWGETGVRLGLLGETDLNMLLSTQRLQGCQIGQYFVRRGVLCSRQLVKKLGAQWLHNQQHLQSDSQAG